VCRQGSGLASQQGGVRDGDCIRKKLEAAVLAQKATREKRLAGAREREAERRREADRQKAAAERAKAEQAPVNNGDG
jgi:hypothetical protein